MSEHPEMFNKDWVFNRDASSVVASADNADKLQSIDEEITSNLDINPECYLSVKSRGIFHSCYALPDNQWPAGGFGYRASLAACYRVVMQDENQSLPQRAESWQNVMINDTWVDNTLEWSDVKMQCDVKLFSVDTLADAAGTDASKIIAEQRKICEIDSKLNTPPTPASVFLLKILVDFDVSRRVARVAFQMCHEVESDVSAGASTIAATVAWMASRAVDADVTQRDVCNIVGCTPVSIRNVRDKIEDSLN